MSLTLTGDGAIGSLSATEVGYLDGVTSGVQSQLNAKLNLAGGKILQIVRATDTTERSTTSTTFVDVTGMSVTITPQKSDSAIIIIAVFRMETNSSTDATSGAFRITDSSNNAISGAESLYAGTLGITGSGTRYFFHPITAIAYATPATTSATTYKLRFLSDVSTTTTFLKNNTTTGQMYAIEVSA